MIFFFLNDPETPEIYPLSLHDALPISSRAMLADGLAQYLVAKRWRRWFLVIGPHEGDRLYAQAVRRAAKRFGAEIDRKSTRLNSSHANISYAVFCLKKKKI